LLEEVQRASATLKALLGHCEQLGQSTVGELRAQLALIDGKLTAQSACAVIIGEEKPRKATFINALLGERLLPNESDAGSQLLYLRRGAAERYTARGERRILEFDRVHPDRAHEVVERIAACEQQVDECARLREQKAREVAQQRDAADQALGQLNDKFAAFELTREEAERQALEVAHQEACIADLERQADAQQRALPRVLRARPSPWHVWLWVAYGIALLIWLGRFQAWQRTRREILVVEAHANRLRISASKAALACRLAEAALDPLATPAESTRAGLVLAQKRLTHLDREIGRLLREVQAARAEETALQAARRRQFRADVAAYCGRREENGDITALELWYPSEHIPEDVTLIDATSGLSRESETEERAWSLVREQADACILVSQIDARLTDATKSRLRRALTLVPHVVLVLTEIDQIYLDALQNQTAAGWEHLDRLRGVAVHRFANEIGCDEQQLLSILLPADTALEEGPPAELVRRFGGEIKLLFELVRLERSLFIGTRMASALDECAGGTREVAERVEHHYEQQIAILEERRRPHPERFRAEQVSAAGPAVQVAAAQITQSVLLLLKGRMNALRAQVVERVLACRHKRQLLSAAPAIEQLIAGSVERTATELSLELDLRADAAVRSIELGVFEALRLRYEIGCLVTRASSPSLHMDDAPRPRKAAARLGLRFERAVTLYTAARSAVGVVGAALGASLGGLALPGLGPWVGAGLGMLLLFAWPFGSAQRRCLQAVDAYLAEPERTLAEQIRGSETRIAGEIRQELDESVAAAMSRFEQWISEPLEADQSAIEHYRGRLRELRAARGRLPEHQKRLAWLSQAVNAAITAQRRCS
jgi:hypothetical protein